MSIYVGKRIGKGVYVGTRGKDAGIVLLVALLIGVACLGWIIDFIKNWWPLLLLIFAGWVVWICYAVKRDAKLQKEATQ